jgi:hypothetical protein
MVVCVALLSVSWPGRSRMDVSDGNEPLNRSDETLWTFFFLSNLTPLTRDGRCKRREGKKRVGDDVK